LSKVEQSEVDLLALAVHCSSRADRSTTATATTARFPLATALEDALDQGIQKASEGHGRGTHLGL
jgi:hypothetical protein